MASAPSNYHMPQHAKSANGLAIAALVVGILGVVVPLLGLVAIVLGAMGLIRSKRPGVGGSGLAIAGLVMGIVSTLFMLLMVAILWPALNRARETANRVKCASQLKRVGQAVLLYANENRGKNPPSFAVLLNSQDLPWSTLVCPGDDVTPATTRWTDDAAARAAKNLSYVYVGEGTDYLLADTEPLVIEIASGHSGDGGNVLFGDGHVEWLPKARMATLVSRLRNSPRLTAEEAAAVTAP